MQRTPHPESRAPTRRAGPRLALIAALLSPLAACEDPYGVRLKPQIDEVRPEPATPGAAVTLIGAGFGLRGARDRVWLGEDELAVESWTETAVLVRLPPREPGLSTLVIRAGARVSAPYPFEIVAPRALDAGPLDDASPGDR